MEETVNIPLLLYGAMWGRSSDNPAHGRMCALKGVDIDRGRQIRL